MFRLASFPGPPPAFHFACSRAWEWGCHAYIRPHIYSVLFVAITTADYLWPQFTPNTQHKSHWQSVCSSQKNCTMTSLEPRLSIPDFVWGESCKTKSRTESLGSRLYNDCFHSYIWYYSITWTIVSLPRWKKNTNHEILCVFVCTQDYLHKIVCGSHDFLNSLYTNIRSIQKCVTTLTILLWLSDHT